MAAKPKSQSSKKKTQSAETSNVTRIKASDTRAKTAAKPKAKTTPAKTVKTKPSEAAANALKVAPVTSPDGKKHPLDAIVRYFKGAWEELRQVRWPNRRTTWSLTGAVLLFTAFFVVLIVLLDFVFQWIFDQVILG